MKALFVGNNDLKNTVRPTPENGERVYIVHWPEVGLMIPWPEGTGAEEAVKMFLDGREIPTAPNGELLRADVDFVSEPPFDPRGPSGN